MKFADIHIHPTLKPYNNFEYSTGEENTLWDFFPVKTEDMKKLSFLIKMAIEETQRDSQANLDECIKGNLRCAFFSMYPVERGLFHPTPKKPFRTLFRVALKKKKYVNLGTAVSGFPREKVRQILESVRDNKGIDYFNKELLKEIEYVVGQTNIISKDGHNFHIATDYDEFRKHTQSEKQNVVGIITIEGAHSLGNYISHDLFGKEYDSNDITEEEKDELRQSFLKNIPTVKTWKDGKNYTPFFITFCHHFNNLLAGHARSLSPMSKLGGLIGIPGMRHLFTQEPNMNKGFSTLGKEVLDLLLSRENGRRILIDTKHMSIETKRYFYPLIRKMRESGDPVPIICSHTAVNGISSYDESEKLSETGYLDRVSYFSQWQINMNDEEILDIYDSDGLIGIVFHEGRMPGGLVKQAIKPIKKKYKKYEGKEDQASIKKFEEADMELRKIYARLILSNIFHILRLIKSERDENGWKIIALGSDYDGLVDPFNTYAKVSDFKIAAQDMIDYIEHYGEDGRDPLHYTSNGELKEFSLQEIEDLLFEKSIEECIKDMMFNNVDTFLSKYFTKEYLES